MTLASDILKEVTARAIGCTEPASIALAAAAASQVLRDKVYQMKIIVDSYTTRNAMAVTIPNTEGETGIAMAAVLGALKGNPEQKLEIFRSIHRDDVEKAKRMISQRKVQVIVYPNEVPIYIDATLETTKSVARAVIKGEHTNIISVELNGEIIRDDRSKETKTVAFASHMLLNMEIPKVISLIEQLDNDDIKFLRKGSEMNMAVARAGFNHGAGLSIGTRLQKVFRTNQFCQDAIHEVETFTSAAVDARMSGSNLPVMANSGSGNQGLVVTIPISIMAKRLGKQGLELDRALAIGLFFAAFSRLRLEKLSTICGSAVAGAIGASAGVITLLNKERELATLIARAINNIVSNISGIFCFGANGSCALKLSVASAVAIQTAFLTIRGLEIRGGVGIISDKAEQSLHNLGFISRSMGKTHECFLDIMARGSTNNLSIKN